MTLPITDNDPLNMVTNWFKKRTHHSGLGTKVESVGSAGSPKGAGQYQDINPSTNVPAKKRINQRLTSCGKKEMVCCVDHRPDREFVIPRCLRK